MASINHVAIWVKDLENMKKFYENYFGAVAASIYHNSRKNFHSYFLSFEGGSRLELMNMSGILEPHFALSKQYQGIAHIAIGVGSKAKVEQLTEELRASGFSIIGEPRTTGDGYYESVVLDPEGNRIEITV